MKKRPPPPGMPPGAPDMPGMNKPHIHPEAPNITRMNLMEGSPTGHLTLHQASDQLNAWTLVEKKVTKGDMVIMQTGRRLTRRNLPEIKSRIQFWNNMLMRIASQQPGMVRGVVAEA